MEDFPRRIKIDHDWALEAMEYEEESDLGEGFKFVEIGEFDYDGDKFGSCLIVVEKTVGDKSAFYGFNATWVVLFKDKEFEGFDDEMFKIEKVEKVISEWREAK